MKYLLVIFVLSSFHGNTLADSHEGKFSQKKSKILARIDKKISLMNSFKSCVSSAKDRSSMKSCRENHKKQMKSFRDENKQYRDKMKKERGM